MSRGFGSTFGAGTTDVITGGYTLQGSDLRSYSIFFNRNGSGGGAFGHLFAKSAGTNFAERAFFDNTAGRIFYTRNNASGTVTSQHGSSWSGIAPFTTLNQWFHLLITHDQTSGSSTTAIMYLDGLAAASTASGTAPTSTANDTDPFLVGNRGAGDRVWDGQLAHFAVWNNVILSQASAVALASGAHPLSIHPEHCVLYLPLDGIHNPEIDLVMANGPAAITIGTKFGTTQPNPSPMYIYSRESQLSPSIHDFVVSTNTIGPMVSMIL